MNWHRRIANRVADRYYNRLRDVWMEQDPDTGRWVPESGAGINAPKRQVGHRKKWKPCGPGKVRNPATRRCVNVAPAIRSLKELEQAALSQISWKDWYTRNYKVVQQIFGPDAETMIKILGATSQASTVKSNLALALKAYQQLFEGTRFEGYLEDVGKNLSRVRKGEWPRGPKIGPYTQALAGDPEAIAVDRHIAELVLGIEAEDDRHSVRGYEKQKADQILRVLARRLGWEPREMQSALWAFNQVRKGKNTSDVESYDTLFREYEKDLQTALQLATDLRLENPIKLASAEDQILAQIDAVRKARQLLRALKHIRR